jgi:transcriptional regulator with XRE-family HTH domain
VNNSIGDRIRRARNNRDYSQEYVAESIGMSTGNYGKIERGDIQANLKHLKAIAKLLSIDFNYLLEDSEDLTSGEPPYIYGIEDQRRIKFLETQVKKLLEDIIIMKAQIAQLLAEKK